MSDSSILVILYHPSCKASQKLLSKLPQECSMIKTVDIRSIKIPNGVKSVPTGIIDKSLINGKVLFEKVDSILNGPVSVDIYGSSNKAGFLDNSSTFNLKSNYSLLEDTSNGVDGFSGVPKFDESQAKTVEELRLERT